MGNLLRSPRNPKEKDTPHDEYIKAVLEHIYSSYSSQKRVEKLEELIKEADGSKYKGLVEGCLLDEKLKSMW